MVTLDEWPLPAKLDFSDDGVQCLEYKYCKPAAVIDTTAHS